MTYVMSDIHGEYEKYLAILEKINFSESDTLFVLGDVVDRGERPVDVLLDMMKRPNVFPIMGNHDLGARDILKRLSVVITEENHETEITTELMETVTGWLRDGGGTTLDQFHHLDIETRQQVLDYFDEFSLMEMIDVGDKTFILTHAGLGNYHADKKLSEYKAEELLLSRGEKAERYYNDDDIYVVSGHTPTHYLTGKAEIFFDGHDIRIDCGAHFNEGRLACLCLETMEEFYA